MTYENIGTDVAYMDTLMMSFETGIDIVSSTLPWDYKDGQKLYWYFDAIAPQTSISFSVKDSVTSNVVLGDYATNTILISSESPDADYTNNSCDVYVVLYDYGYSTDIKPIRKASSRECTSLSSKSDLFQGCI